MTPVPTVDSMYGTGRLVVVYPGCTGCVYQEVYTRHIPGRVYIPGCTGRYTTGAYREVYHGVHIGRYTRVGNLGVYTRVGNLGVYTMGVP